MGQQTATGEKSWVEKTVVEKSLEACRQQIDALDTELVRLLNERAAIACEIAVVKVASGLPAYDGKREDQVLARVAAKNTGPLDAQSVIVIFRGIIQETRRLGTQRMMFLNPERSEGSL
jgi:chorismate mutase/prephenate dehydratase